MEELFTSQEIEELRSQLPPRYRELISEKTKVSIPTIARFFAGSKIRENNAEIIYDAALEVIEEHQNRTAYRKKKLRTLMTNKQQQSLNFSS
ncbi:MAG TPA: hypothetical protein VIN73_12085 [Vicingaceae bacterium]